MDGTSFRFRIVGVCSEWLVPTQPLINGKTTRFAKHKIEMKVMRWLFDVIGLSLKANSNTTERAGGNFSNNLCLISEPHEPLERFSVSIILTHENCTCVIFEFERLEDSSMF
jgi:hypothetical protein